MKRTSVTVIFIYAMLMVLITLCGCAGSRQIHFADEQWQLSRHFGQIINEDTTCRLTFGNVLIPVDMPIIASADSLARYNGLDRFMAQILHTTRLDSAEVLFYAPEMALMFVRPRPERSGIQPVSISSNIDDERPCTIGVYEDFGEDWKRRPDEMFTYTFVNRRRKQILVVDYFTYVDQPLVQIKVLQTETGRTKKLGFRRGTFSRHDINDRNRIESLSDAVVSHRKLAFGNYRIGQEIKREREKRYASHVSKADSCMQEADYIKALQHLKEAMRIKKHPDSRVTFNTACAAAQTGEHHLAMSLLQQLVDEDRDWYIDDPIGSDGELKPLAQTEGWKAFADTMTSRRARIEANYDHALRRQLKEIARRDQDVRHRFLHAYNRQPRDSAAVQELLAEMRATDERNLTEIKHILATRGWPGKELVGDACSAIWLVIQHSDVETQKEALPMLKEGVIRGELNSVQIAMLEDRILVHSGEEQIYGTQYYWEEKDGKKELKIYPIRDADKVDLRRESIGLEPLHDAYAKIK